MPYAPPLHMHHRALPAPRLGQPSHGHGRLRGSSAYSADRFDSLQQQPFSPHFGSNATWRPLALSPQWLGGFSSPAGYPTHLFCLPNGHRIVIEQRPTDVVSLRTFVDAGSIVERPMLDNGLYPQSPHPSGIAHLDEHCHFLATEQFKTKNAWIEAVERYGVGKNASTGHEVIQHEITFNKEDLGRILALHGEMVLHPYYGSADIQQEKINVLNECLERSSQPMFKIANKAAELVFGRPDMQTLGTKEDVLRTSPEQLQRFFDECYRPDAMLTVLSGNVDIPTTLQACQRAFGVNPARPGYRQSGQGLQWVLPPNTVSSATVFDPRLVNSVVHLTFQAPARHQLRERMALTLINAMLSGGNTPLLGEELQDKQRLINQYHSEYSPYKHTGTLSLALSTDPGKEKQTADAALQLIEQFSKRPVLPDTLDRLRQQLLLEYQHDLQDVEATTHWLGSEALTATPRQFQSGQDFYRQFVPLLYSITPLDLMQTARRYLTPSRYAVVYGKPISKPGGLPL